MSNQWIGVYVSSDDDAKRLMAALPNLKQTIPTLDWDQNFEVIRPEDEIQDEPGEVEQVEGVYQAMIARQGQPVTTLEEARRIAALTGEVQIDSPEDPDNGLWLITFGLRTEDQLKAEGFMVWESVDSDDPWVVTVEMP